LYLGIVLAAVVVLTGIFYYSQKKTFIYFFEILRHFFSF
jgi:hypothetical protein